MNKSEAEKEDKKIKKNVIQEIKSEEFVENTNKIEQPSYSLNEIEKEIHIEILLNKVKLFKDI